MIAIAHRGLWFPDPKTQNTTGAAESAVKAGCGVEIDVFAAGNLLCVGHTVPRKIGDSNVSAWAYDGGTLPADYFFPILKDAPLIAWNIKNNGCAPLIIEAIERLGAQDRSFVFDQELIGESYAGSACPILLRASDREPIGDSLKQRQAIGIWLDAFESDWVTSDVIKTVHDAGKKAYVVSPELHGRRLDLSLWFDWADADGICTDYPHLLQALFNGKDLYPREPWW
ncbi:MAG: hypothetical protein ACREJ6_11945 [Candidatus Methylomirabilis sp.]